MNKDEQLILQLLQAYKNGQIDFSKVPALTEIIHQEANESFNWYTEQISERVDKTLEKSELEMQAQTQERLNQLSIKSLTDTLLSEIETENKKLFMAKLALERVQEENTLEQKRRMLANWTAIVANIACLLAFLVVCVFLGRWAFQGVWHGWGLQKLWEATITLQPEHPYGAVVLGVLGFGLIAGALYASFLLMYQTATHLDNRPVLFKKLFPKK